MSEWGLKLVLPAVFGVVFLIGLTGNVAILLLVASKKKMHSATNIFIGLLAFGDLLIVLFCMPFTVPALYIFERWVLGIVVCRAVIFMQNVSIFISATTLTAMAIERYLVLVHPMKAMTVWTKKTAVQCSLGILIYSFLSALPISILPSMSPAWPSNNSYHCNPAEPQNFVAAFQVTRITLTYFLPLAIMAVLYALIIRKLLHNSNLFSPSQKALEDRQRVVYMLIAMVIIFAACWLPSTLVILLSTFDEKFYENNKSSLTTYVPVTTFLVYFNCIMNPFLYSLMSSQYRRGFISLFKRLGCCCGLSKVKGQDVPSVASVSDVTGKVSLNSSQCSY